MSEIEIKPEDIEEKFIRSRGKGGQNVNKVATCVQLKHLPSGIMVKCEKFRSQSKNRELALKLLIEKIQKIEDDKIKNEKAKISKLNRANRKRPKILKEKILEEKRLTAEKKKLRKKIR